MRARRAKPNTPPVAVCRRGHQTRCDPDLRTQLLARFGSRYADFPAVHPPVVAPTTMPPVGTSMNTVWFVSKKGKNLHDLAGVRRETAPSLSLRLQSLPLGTGDCAARETMWSRWKRPIGTSRCFLWHRQHLPMLIVADQENICGKTASRTAFNNTVGCPRAPFTFRDQSREEPGIDATCAVGLARESGTQPVIVLRLWRPFVASPRDCRPDDATST